MYFQGKMLLKNAWNLTVLCDKYNVLATKNGSCIYTTAYLHLVI